MTSGNPAELLMPQGRTDTYYRSQQVGAVEAGLCIVQRRPVMCSSTMEKHVTANQRSLMLRVCSAVHF